MPLDNTFAAALTRLGPFGPAPRLAVAVSGGADSTALALLAQSWAAQNNATLLALIVDHGLRDSSAAEAALTSARLASRGILSQILTLTGITPPALQEKARLARYAPLAAAAMAEGRLHLLLGHHAADQSETVAMRAQRGPSGTEGIAAWTARHSVILLRPLLETSPAALRAYLTAHAMPWIEDPSNQLQKFERIRLRQSGHTATPASPEARQSRERDSAAYLARHATFYPQGYATLTADSAPPAALGALIRTLGGAIYPPAQKSLSALAAALRPATLGGVRISPAGRFGPGWLLTREPAACAPPIPATQGALWDNRFHLPTAAPGATLGPLGADAKAFKNHANLPTLILRAQPCLRGPSGALTFPAPAHFRPPAPATALPFHP